MKHKYKPNKLFIVGHESEFPLKTNIVCHIDSVNKHTGENEIKTVKINGWIGKIISTTSNPQLYEVDIWPPVNKPHHPTISAQLHKMFIKPFGFLQFSNLD